MKARLAKKIIKASDAYNFYCRECNPHSRFKYHPYWTNQWFYRTTLKRYPTTIVKSFDQRLDFALHRLPTYMLKLLNAIKIKRMDLKRIQWSKALDLIEQMLMQQCIKEESANENISSLIGNKMRTV